MYLLRRLSKVMKVVVRWRDRVVGRFHGPYASHVVVVVLRSGRVQCRGWGLRKDAERALERILDRESGLVYARVHETSPDPGDARPLVRRVHPWRPRHA